MICPLRYSKTAPDSSRESSSDEEPDGILTFTSLQNEGMRESQISNPTSEAVSDLPANHQVPHEEMLEKQWNSRSQQNQVWKHLRGTSQTLERHRNGHTDSEEHLHCLRMTA